MNIKRLRSMRACAYWVGWIASRELTPPDRTLSQAEVVRGVLFTRFRHPWSGAKGVRSTYAEGALANR